MLFIDSMPLISLCRSFSSLLWPEKQVSVATSQAEINIFTVASGLLYEVGPCAVTNWIAFQ